MDKAGRPHGGDSPACLSPVAGTVSVGFVAMRHGRSGVAGTRRHALGLIRIRSEAGRADCWRPTPASGRRPSAIYEGNVKARRRPDAMPPRGLKGDSADAGEHVTPVGTRFLCRPKWKRRPAATAETGDMGKARLATIHVAFAGKSNQPRRAGRFDRCKWNQAALGNPSVKSRCLRWLT